MINFERAGVPQWLIRAFKIQIAFVRIIARIIGLRCTYFSNKTGQFELSTFDRAYSTVILIILIVGFPFALPLVYKGARNVIPSNSVPALIGTFSVIFNFIVIILIYLKEVVNSKKIIKYLNGVSQEIEERFLRDATIRELCDPLFYFLFKFLICEVVFLLTNAFSMISVIKQFGSSFILVGVLSMYPYLVHFTVSTTVFIGSLRLKFFFRLLNKNLMNLAREVQKNNIAEMRQYERISFSCNLSDKLDEYSLYYESISNATKGLLDLYSLQLLLLIINNFIATTFQMFLQYVFTRLIFMGRLEANITLASFSMVVLIIGFLDFTMHGIVGQHVRDEAKRTGLILHKIPTHQMDIRFRRSIETFSLQVLHENPSLSICGFFILDIGLISSVIAGISSYVLILIQFDQAQEAP
ncbi:gustatory receptor for bitter taste 93a-like [Phlebotomus argentipes]|uniref:gustatory receptor for bitter taste 93a-like n=1 Tax=Phlebotomus argentipes TaxID=94469 RepID=UPI002893165A|nr:gustatory receptor for bitter taste 93a-like [Phlebotomus argentipes]